MSIMQFSGMQFNGAFSLGTSKKTNGWVGMRDTKPGPGTYTPSFWDKPKFPKWNFLKGKRKSIITPTTNPPPGTYESKTFVGEGLKFSLASKINKKNKTDLIGPGSYEAKIPPQQPSFPAFSFGYKQDPKDMDNKVPGPGAYPKEINEDQLSEQDLLRLSRMKMRSEREKFRKTGFGFSSRDSQRLLKTDNPGPGHYNPRNFDKLLSPSFKFGFQNRAGLYTSEQIKHPGPGQYETKSTFGSSHGFTIYGKIDPDFTKNEKKPGPESYNPYPIKSSSTITIGNGLRSKFEGKLTQIPGPGNYNPRLIQTAHSFSVGSGKRSNLIVSDNPGPGEYGLNSSTLGGPKHCIAAKLEKKNAQMKYVCPGPGAYDPNHELVFSQGPIVSVKKDKKMKDPQNTVPGPGNYNIKRELGGNKFSFGGTLKKPKASIYLEPGPGHYDIPSTIGYIPKYLAAKTNNDFSNVPNYFDFKNF